MFRLQIAGLKANIDEIKGILAEGHDINLVFTKEQIEASGSAAEVCVAGLPAYVNQPYLYSDLANRSLLDLYFQIVIAAWASGSFGDSGESKFKGYPLSEHLNFVAELYQSGARPQAAKSELASVVLDFIALNLVQIQGYAQVDEIPAAVRNAMSSSRRLLETFAQYHDKIGFYNGHTLTAEEIPYFLTLLQQKQLPSDRNPLCDVALKGLLARSDVIYAYFGTPAFDAIKEKSDYDRADAMSCLYRMYEADKSRFNLAILKIFGEKTLEILENFTVEGKTKNNWDVNFNGESCVTWVDFYLWRSKALVQELVRLKEFNEAKGHLRAWLNFLSGYFLECDHDEIPLLFLEWSGIASSVLEKDFVRFANEFFGIAPQQVRVVLQAPGQIPAPALAVLTRDTLLLFDRFFLFHSEVMNQTNPSNVSLIAKPLLSLMTLISVVVEGKEKQIKLHPQMGMYLKNPRHFAHFQKCKNELEAVVKAFDNLSSFVVGSNNLLLAW